MHARMLCGSWWLWCAQVQQLEQALLQAQSANQQHDAAAARTLLQLEQAQLQLQSQAAILDQLSARRERLKQKNIRLKAELAAAAHDREAGAAARQALAHELDAALRARVVADAAAAEARAAAEAARREKSEAEGACAAAAATAAARSSAAAAEAKSLKEELEQAVEARDTAQSMLSSINDRCFELMQQCRHLTQLQRDAESQLANVTRDFECRFESTVLDLEQEETRASEEEAARCKLELRVHDLEQRLRAADAAGEVARQQLVQQRALQLQVEKQQGKAVKHAAELRLARDEVRVFTCAL